ncbi:MAG: hypothetical protein AABY30_05345, partial [Candidatus Thermoplasmatota archaeon]
MRLDPNAYAIWANASDLGGNALGPYLLRFSTTCPPRVTAFDATTAGVVHMEFTKAIGSSTWNVSPPANLKQTWRLNNTIVDVVPDPPLQPCTMYDFQVWLLD